MRRDIPNLAGGLPPLTYAAQARAALAEAEAILRADVLVDELIEDADHRYQLCEARKERRWSPPWRCDKCHAVLRHCPKLHQFASELGLAWWLERNYPETAGETR